MRAECRPAAEAVATQGISARLAALLAVVAAVSVANVYYAQPLLGPIGADLAVGTAALGLITALTQVGYLLGLIAIVPLGDLMSRRLLAVRLSWLAAVGCALAATATRRDMFLAAVVMVGLVSVLVQVIVAYGAALSAPGQRGRVVGVVTSGIVTGILLARSVSGLVGDLLGWRAVFAMSAVLLGAVAVVLAHRLPADTALSSAVSYRRSLASVFTLTATEPVFRVRSTLGLLVFVSFGAFWGAIALPLAAPPWELSPAQIGLFGIAGVAGAWGAANAGRWADRGRAQVVTGAALVLIGASWAVIAAAPESLVLLAIGVVALDLGGQAVHVTNQHLIVGLDPLSSSRLIGSYMVFYSLGSGAGAMMATALYARHGWGAVSIFGASVSVLALLVWSADLAHRPRDRQRL